ncbi:prostaglandin E synthase 2-like [Chenopodium quinoa]|uniref:prostaglandin E synthase 2-like n=1 Tax=Chenopodium quinoa TaxID=63459 RepID=UPI000B77BFF5|nr:prostaglandin E synthase 2-like [Chenopodium quinoa]
MNRITSLAALRRATAATAAASFSQTRSLQQAAPFSSSASSHWFSGRFIRHFGSTSPASHSLPSNGIAGTMFFSVAAATTLTQEAHAKEPIQSQIFKDVVLYQYEACPFCNKVKAFLDYYNIPYKVVEVNPIGKKEIKWSDYKKVPILTVDGEQMIESSEIIQSLYKKIHPEGSTGSSTSTEEEKKWLGWVDSHLVHVLSPNIYRSAGEALESFDYIATHGNFGFMEKMVAKYAGATAMYFVAKKLKKKYNITDERESLYQSAETWVDALKGRPFLGDSKPNLADLAVFGVLRPIRNLQSGRDMVEHTRIGDWYSRMEKAVGESCRVTV